MMPYSTVEDVRNESLPVSEVEDPRIETILELVARYIDKVCGQWFESRSMTLYLDGPGHMTLFFDVPIISVTSIKEVDASKNPVVTYDSTSYVVYNRHLQNMTYPDDRANPKIERRVPTVESRLRIFGDPIWPRGQQNIEVVGKFGFTDYDSTNVEGKTPDLIKRVSVLLTLREVWERYGQADESEEARNRGRVVEEKTRDQSYKLAGTASSLADSLVDGRLTGDPEIDSILLMYRRIIGITSV